MSLRPDHPSYRMRTAHGHARFEARYYRTLEGAMKAAKRYAERYQTIVHVDYRDELADGTPLAWHVIGGVHHEDPDTWLRLGRPASHNAPTIDEEAVANCHRCGNQGGGYVGDPDSGYDWLDCECQRPVRDNAPIMTEMPMADGLEDDAEVIELLTLLADGAYIRSRVESIADDRKGDVILAALFRTLATLEELANHEGLTVSDLLNSAGLLIANAPYPREGE